MIESLSKISGLSSSSESEKSSMDGVFASLGGTSMSSMTSNMGIQAQTPANATGLSFADVIGNMASSTVGNLKQAEQDAIGGMTGKVSNRQVVDSVMQADQSLHTALALRDKLVTAYLDITKMQI